MTLDAEHYAAAGLVFLVATAVSMVYLRSFLLTANFAVMFVLAYLMFFLKQPIPTTDGAIREGET